MKLEDRVRNVTQLVEEDAANVLNNAYNGLVLNVVRNKIPEDIFSNYFLPCFLGQRPENTQWVLEWISIAGTPISEVDVVDPYSNEILFTVPGILNTNGILSNQRGQNNFDNIFNRSQQLSNNLPSVGANFLMNALNNKSENLIAGLNIDDKQTKWNFILNRYGITHSQFQTQASDNTPQDVFEY
jgi:hypothetical protein